MIEGVSDNSIADELLMIAHDPGLRQSVYQELGEYCHTCRNRLNSLKLSIFLAMRLSNDVNSDRWSFIERQYLELERSVDRVQALCRPMTLSMVSIAFDLLIEERADEWADEMAVGGCLLECVPPPTRAVAAFDVERMGQVLDAIVQWRAGGVARGRTARLQWWVEAGTAHVAWSEEGTSPDGPAPEGAKWVMPLVARVILTHHGEYRVAENQGWRLEFSWPSMLASA